MAFRFFQLHASKKLWRLRTIIVSSLSNSGSLNVESKKSNDNFGRSFFTAFPYHNSFLTLDASHVAWLNHDRIPQQQRHDGSFSAHWIVWLRFYEARGDNNKLPNLTNSTASSYIKVKPFGKYHHLCTWLLIHYTIPKKGETSHRVSSLNGTPLRSGPGWIYPQSRMLIKGKSNPSNLPYICIPRAPTTSIFDSLFPQNKAELPIKIKVNLASRLFDSSKMGGI